MYQHATGSEHVHREHITHLKGLAVESCKQEVLNDIQKMHDDREELSDTQKARARGHIGRADTSA